MAHNNKRKWWWDWISSEIFFIDASKSAVWSALEKHPNLKSYYLVISIDRAYHGEYNKKSFKDR